MPGVFQLSVDEAVREAAAAKADGVPGVLLFGLPDDKDIVGSGAYDPEAPVQAATRAIKQDVPGLLVVTDVCLCEYTSHGHCGILVDDEIANDVTVEQLVRAALSQAAAGADLIAPSDMMDGRVGRIRTALDEAGFTQTAIMSYAAKYCSAFYGPFREAADSAPARRIDVSVSIIARGSSIQPLRAAALSIAYSPLTWYAAVGWPNSAFTRAMTSR